jgi:Carbohydrate binding domain (family 32)
MKNNLLYLLIFGLLFGCNKVKPIEKKKSKFERVWFDTVQMIPFSAKLQINKNNTFEYKSHSCQVGSKSNGTWSIKNDTIVLNSIKPKGCHLQYPFGIVCAFNKGNTQKNEENQTIKGCNPSESDVIYEIFQNEKFYIRNDTLIHLNKIKEECPNLKVVFSKYEKVRKVNLN